MARSQKSDPACADDPLLRLAETSPHLLRDIGFVQDPVTGVWTDGRRRVEAGRRDRAADLLRAGRG